MSDTHQADDAIISRIQALLALANDGRGNENEMGNAAALAQKLMTKYNLSMATVEANSKTTGERQKVQTTERQSYMWRRELMVAVAKLYFCHATGLKKWVDGKAKFVGYQLIGRPANVATAQMMYDYLTGTIDRLAADRTQGDHRQLFSKATLSFRKGASDRVIQRLNIKRQDEVEISRRAAEAAKHRAAAGNTTNAVAVVLSDFVSDEADLNTDMLHGLQPGTTKAQRMANAAAYNAASAARKAKTKQLVEDGFPPRVAELMAWGYEYDDAVKQARKEDKPETEAQARARRARDEAWARKERNRARRDSERYDASAYREGRAAGDDIALNQQVDQKSQTKIS
jgi:Protein of unknown function (DUF2786)